MDPVGKILGYTQDDIEKVQNMDSWAQENNPTLDKQLSRIFSFADKEAQGYGWGGIAKKNPEVFKQALSLISKY